MNSRTTEAMATEHVREMHRSAGRRGTLSGCRDPRRTIGERTGWTLVSIGLRLASRSDGA